MHTKLKAGRRPTLLAALLMASIAVAAQPQLASAQPVVVPFTNMTTMIPPGNYFFKDGVVGNWMPRNPFHSEIKSYYEEIGATHVLAMQMMLIPGTDDFLYVSQPGMSSNSTEKDLCAIRFSPFKYTSERVHFQSNPFCSIAAGTPTGGVAFAGGSGRNMKFMVSGLDKIQSFNPSVNRSYINDSTTMAVNRWYPTATLLPNKHMFIMGGVNGSGSENHPSPVYEIWDTERPTIKPMLFDMDSTHFGYAKKHLFPYQFVLPTGIVMSMAHGRTRFFHQNGSYVKTSSGSYLSAPSLPDRMGHNIPRTASCVMLPLTPWTTRAEIVVFGGQTTDTDCGDSKMNAAWVQSHPASRTSYRLRVTATASGDSFTYSFSWTKDDMGIRRVGGYATLIPNGDVMVVSGTQSGCVGNAIYNTMPGDFGSHWPVLYQPERKLGQRFTVLNASRIVRLYHDSASLTTDGTVLVGGCDVCNNTLFTRAADFYSPNPAGLREYRNEIFHTPYSLDVANRPTIESITVRGVQQGPITVLPNGGTATMTWGNAYNVTGMTLVAPGAATHSWGPNQRVIHLQITRNEFAAKKVTFRIPTNANIAISQYYMLFALYDKTYSKAAWVHVKN